MRKFYHWIKKNMTSPKSFLFAFIFLGSGLTAQINYTADTYDGCSPLTVTFTNTSGSGNYYNWDYDDGSYFDGVEESHTFMSAGEYRVRMSAFDTTGGNWNFLGESEQIISVYGLGWGGPNMSEACPGESVDFYYNGIGTSYLWYFGDGDSSLLEYPSHTYPGAGTYNIMFILTHPCGVDTSFSSILVDPSAIPYVDFQVSNNVGCPMDDFSFEYWGAWSNNNQYNWDFGDGSPAGNSDRENHAYADTGMYIVNLIVTNMCGNSDFHTDTVYVGDSITIENVGLFIQPGCPGDEINFPIWGNQGNPTFQNYVWDFGDGNGDSVANPIYAYADTGAYNVSVMVTNGCGFDTTLTSMAIVGDSIYPELDPNNFGTPDDGGEPCPGDSVLFYYAGTGIDIVWDFGDGNSAVATEEIYVEEQGGGFWVTIVKHAYTAVGTYTPIITVTNGCGLSSSDSIQIIIGSTGLALADFIWEVPQNGPNYFACEQVSLISIGGMSYGWDFGDGNTSSTNSTSISHSYAVFGDYDITMTVTNGCGNSDIMVQTITIDGMGGNTMLTDVTCNGGNDGAIDLEITGGVAPITVLWDNGATTEDLINIPAGSYLATVTDANGCVISGSDVINEPTAISVITGSTQSTCLGASGSAGAVVSGGVAPYTYAWSPVPSTNDTILSVPAGIYSFTVTDANGCIAMESISVNDAGAPSIVVDLVTDVLCNGQSTGAMDVSISGGTTPYIIDWNAGTYSTEDIASVPAGAYNLSVSDANGCIASVSDTVFEAVPLPIPTVTQTGDSLMSSVATTYQWNTGGSPIGGEMGQYLAPSSNGYYTVTITDINGCSSTSDTTLFQFTSIVELNTISMEVYPNPVSEVLTLNLINNSGKDLSIILMNTTGQILEKKTYNESGNFIKEIDFTNLSHGMYYLTLNNGVNIVTKKIVK